MNVTYTFLRKSAKEWKPKSVP